MLLTATWGWNSKASPVRRCSEFRFPPPNGKVWRRATLIIASLFPDSRCKLVHFRANFLALDVSYRDDLRTFVAWNSTSGLNETVLIDWCWKHFLRRFQHGTMVLEEAEPCNFVGLNCVWNGSQLAFAPQIPYMFTGFCYRLVDSFPLMPWCSWIPPQQRINAVRGLMCRVF